MAYTYGDLLRDLAQADPSMPVRVRMAGGQARDVTAVEVEYELTMSERPARHRDADGAEAAGITGPEERHRPLAAIIALG